MLFNAPQLFLKTTQKDEHTTAAVIPNSVLYYLALHIKLSTLTTAAQLVDMLAYELPYALNTGRTHTTAGTTVLVHNLHLLGVQQRILLLTLCNGAAPTSAAASADAVGSVSELFTSAVWLEREVAELHGLFFLYKRDLRNLILPYNDTTAPLQKALPSIGLREITYDTINDTILNVPVTVQF